MLRMLSGAIPSTWALAFFSFSLPERLGDSGVDDVISVFDGTINSLHAADRPAADVDRRLRSTPPRLDAVCRRRARRMPAGRYRSEAKAESTAPGARGSLPTVINRAPCLPATADPVAEIQHSKLSRSRRRSNRRD